MSAQVRSARSAPGRPPAEVAASPTRTVPFDYVVTFPIDGVAGNVHTDTINISTVGTFVVTAIGYSLLLDSRFGPIEPDDDAGIDPRTNPPVVTVLPPAVTPVVVKSARASRSIPGQGNKRVRRTAAARAPTLRVFGTPGATVAILVNGEDRQETGEIGESGQLDLASLSLNPGDSVVAVDRANGLSSRSIQVFEHQGVLRGPPQFGPRLPVAGSSRIEIVAAPGAEVTITVRSRQGTRRTEADTIVAEPGIATIAVQEPLAFGDTVIVQEAGDGPSGSMSTFSIGGVLNLTLGNLPRSALAGGFRVIQSILRNLDVGVASPPADLAQPFQRCGSSCDFSFLYSISDNGTGRAFQNEPIHNVAGLGISNGDRPFRVLPRPIVLEPRSVLLFRIEEVSGGPGTLYLVLQGYKVVGASPFA